MLPIVRSLPAPVEITVTVPLVAALIAPVVTTAPIDAVNDMFPAALVVIAPTFKLPVNRVKVKLRLLAVTVVNVKLDAVVATLYAVKPIPLFVLSKAIVCRVFALAVNVNVDNIPVDAACNCNLHHVFLRFLFK